MLKAGVLGAGHLGKIHLKLLQQSSKYELVGFYDPIEDYADQVAEEFGYTRFDSVEKRIDACDVVDIVTPTLNHFDCAQMSIEKGKHIFIEKLLICDDGIWSCTFFIVYCDRKVKVWRLYNVIAVEITRTIVKI